MGFSDEDIIRDAKKNRWPMNPRGSSVAKIVAKIEIGQQVDYRRRSHVVIGVTPVGVTPTVLELEDVQSGRIRHVNATDPALDLEPIERAQMMRNPDDAERP